MLPILSVRRIWKTALLVLADFLSLIIGGVLVFVVRYRWLGTVDDTAFFFNLSDVKVLTFAQYFLLVGLYSVFVVLIYAFLGLYQIKRNYSLWETVIKLTFGILVSLTGLIIFFFFNEYNRNAFPIGLPIGRFILGVGGFFALYFVLLGRLLMWFVEQLFYSLKLLQAKVIIIGNTPDQLRQKIANRRDISEFFTYSEVNKTTFEEIANLIRKHEVAEVYLENSKDFKTDIALLCERYKVAFYYFPNDLSDFDAFAIQPLFLDGLLYIEFKHSNLDGWWVICKRLFDVVFSVLALVVFSPLLIITALAIKIEDAKGPIFYLSERMGPDGKIFKLFKFRRLKTEFCTSESNPQAKEALAFEAELIKEKDMKKDGVLYKISDDPRTTRVGRFIEKYSIDELPQFLNVLFGTMSIVGPRPHQPREVAKYKQHHYKVLNIKPGITGLAQVSGRSDLSFENEVKLDVSYLEKWNFFTDLWIIIMTPISIIKGHKQ